ncbi:MAG: DUF3592 domain-containing protein [Thermoanaerobaculia bacterium]
MQIVLLVIGFGCVAVGVLLIVSARRISATGRRFDAEVAGYAQTLSKKGSRTYAPVLSFRHPRAGRCYVQHAIGSGSIPYEVGRRVRVVVSEQEPMRGRLDSNGPYWFGGVILAIGIVLSIVFFTTFRPGIFSTAVPVAVIVVLVARARRAKTSMNLGGKIENLKGGVEKMLRSATTGEVVPESAFDRSTLAPPAEIEAVLRGQPRQAIVGGIILLLLGAAALTGSWFWVGKRFAYLERASSAEGVVVEMVRSSGSKGTTWAPVIEFTPAGEWGAVRFRHKASSSNPSWRVGDRTPVLYDPERPQDAMVDYGWGNRAMPFIPAVIGTLLVFLGTLSLRSGMRRRQPVTRYAAPVVH